MNYYLNREEISKYLQIDPPFLMIEEVEIDPGKSARATKNLRSDDWFFGCHLKREMAMPGTLQIEAMLQTLVLTLYTLERHKGYLSFITDIKTKLISKVSPDCLLAIEAELSNYKRGIGKGIACGKVNNQIVCQGEFTFVSPHEFQQIRPPQITHSSEIS
jgi:3-hydroxyacyl-[acyl-carrier-protein] dehydratase